MASGLLLLLDDIATILDDVAVMSKMAAKKTAGVLGDDLALNAQQVSGVRSDRELSVVWSVAKGSFVNKLILVPLALLISVIAAWLINPLLMIGGLFLCYEGVEKVVHMLHHKKAQTVEEASESLQQLEIDLDKFEKEKIKGAVRTDFILSAEIIVISLGTVATQPFLQQLVVLVAIALIMTVGVYGLVGGIVKLDDVGLYLTRTAAGKTSVALGRAILAFAPKLMRFLSVAGTAAMFLVGGGILAHGIGPLHHWIAHVSHGPLAWLWSNLLNAGFGVLAGALVLAVVTALARLRGKGLPAH